jgi:hypothetical protein
MDDWPGGMLAPAQLNHHDDMVLPPRCTTLSKLANTTQKLQSCFIMAIVTTRRNDQTHQRQLWS